jgi:hypothetical protein
MVNIMPTEWHQCPAFLAGLTILLRVVLALNASAGGMFGYASPWVNDRPWYMQPLWDLSSCCKDTDENKFFALVRAIFGYQVRQSMMNAAGHVTH